MIRTFITAISFLLLIGCKNQKPKENLTFKHVEKQKIENVIINATLEKELKNLIQNTRKENFDEENLFFSIAFYEENNEDLVMIGYTIQPPYNLDDFVGFYQYDDIYLIIFNSRGEEIPDRFINIGKLNHSIEELRKLRCEFLGSFDPTCYIYYVKNNTIVFKEIYR